MTEKKKPQDHLPKQEELKIKDVTVMAGDVEVNIPADAFNDFELLDDISQVEDGNGQRVASVVRRLVGDQWRAVMDGLRGENGRVAVEDATEFLERAMEAANPNS